MTKATQEYEALLDNFQNSDGSFSANAFSETGESLGLLPPTTFMTSLVLSQLNRLNGFKTTKERAANFLLRERSAEWSWNYDARTPAHSQYGRYPDDLDDTALALTALASQLPAEALAAAVKHLTRNESAVGGPYQTWLVDSNPRWSSIDPIVNTNIAIFLSIHGVSLPALVHQVEAFIDVGRYATEFYPNPLVSCNLISRWYRGPKRTALKRNILKMRRESGFGSPLQTALAVGALNNLGYPKRSLGPEIEYIKGSQAEWRAEPFYLDSRPKSGALLAGSTALTLAYCLETVQITDEQTPEFIPKNSTFHTILQRISAYPAELRAPMLTQINRTSAIEAVVPISNLCLCVCQALGKRASTLPARLATELGAALVYGWTAFSIYDDIFDETHRPALLPVANSAYREMLHYFKNCLPRNCTFSMLRNEVLAAMDAAQVWEYAHTRFDKSILRPIDLPKYGNLQVLADRAGGYALGPLGIFCAIDTNPNELLRIRKFFDQLTIARQLTDDAHDWEEDLRHGQINSVAAILLREYFKTATFIDIQSPESLNVLRTLFWNTTIEEIDRNVSHSLDMAKSALLSLDLEYHEHLLSLLRPTMQQMAQAMEERRRTLAFIAAYTTVTRSISLSPVQLA